MAAERATQMASVERRLAELEEARLFSGQYDAGDAIVTIHPGAGGTESQDWAEMLVRMYLRWAERSDYATETLDYQPGEEAGVKSATFMVKGENAYRQPRGRARRPPPGADLARSTPRRAATPASPGRRLRPHRRGGRGRDRRKRPAHRHLPRLRRRRPARQQDRLGGADHAHSDRHRRPVPERALPDRRTRRSRCRYCARS